MVSKPSSCTGCALQRERGFVPADGSGANGVLLVGEAAGENEAREGKPFIGEAGWLLDRILKRVGEDRENFRVHNVLSCRPPGNWLAGASYEFSAISHCAPNLDATIREMRPRAIVALGNVATRRLTGMSGISRLRGWPLEGVAGASGSWVVPTYHPSFLLPRPGQKDTSRLIGAVVLDIKKALGIARNGFTRETPFYILDPDPVTAMRFVLEYEAALRAQPGTLLSWDIETPGKLAQTDEEELDEADAPLSNQILRISFCFRPGYAMSVPWAAPWMGVIQRLLRSAGGHVVWNGYAFDLPVLATNGERAGGRVYDGMWAWHMLQSDLPRGLEAVGSFYASPLGPWKHRASSDPAWYNACDADVALRNMLGIKADLEKTGQWRVYERHVVDLWPVLWEAGRRGLLIDRTAQDELRVELAAIEGEKVAHSQTLVPRDLKPRKRWKKFPKDRHAMLGVLGGLFEKVLVPGKVKECSLCGALGITKTKHMKGACRKGEIRLVDGFIDQWDETLPFNPHSADQLKAYAKHYRHPLGSSHKTKGETLDKKQLEKLIKAHGAKHPIYELVRELREVSKTLSTYVEGFAPDSRGRIVTTYSFAPSTGRLSSRAVNLQNVSHRSENKYAERIRRTIVPAPGHVFVEADSSAIEAVLTGFFMKDPDYVERARQGVHAWLACVELGWDFNALTKMLVKKSEKPLYDRKKRTVHGVSYGMGAALLAQQYPKDFASKKAAQTEIDFFLAAVPRLGDWHHEVRMQAHKEGFLRNPWGYTHAFYDVFKKDRHGKIALGTQGKAVIAFLPQSSAAAFMRDTLLLLGESKWRQYMPANCTIHDSCALEVPEAMAEEAAEFLCEVMSRPIPELGGLRVGVEAKIYRNNWAEDEAYRVVEVAA